MKTNKYLAYTNCTHNKEQAVALAQQHQDLDAYTRGFYGEGEHGTPEFKGCSVGCLSGGNNHEAFPALFGFDPRIAYLQDVIFENLSGDKYKTFTLELMQAIPVGADTTKIYAVVMAKILRRAAKHDKSTSCNDVAVLFDLLQNDVFSVIDWADAMDAAGAATGVAHAASMPAAKAAARAAEAAADASLSAEYDLQRQDLLDACKMFEATV